ncbi:MAG: MAPEG family protein [Devosia sp.]
MTVELWLLFLSLPLYGLYLGAQSLFYRMQYGVIYAATARDDEAPAGPILARADKAMRNFLETWPVFIVLALIAHLAAPGDGLILWGAIIYMAGRVVYLPLYLFGVFAIRSLVWNVATIGLALMFFAIAWGALF